jgi:hypothetical protein
MRANNLSPSPSLFPSVRVIPALTALLAAAAGCDPIGPDGPEPIGLASLNEVWVNLHHRDGNIDLVFSAPMRFEGQCPTLAEDLTITANGTPLALSLYDFSDAISFGCTISSLDGAATLPDAGGPLRIAFQQGSRTASMVIENSAFPAFVGASVSRTQVPVGESFAVNVAVPDADAATREALASPYDWVVSLCEPSGCVPGQGWIGLQLTNGGAREGGLGFDATVTQGIPPGKYALGVHNFDPGFAPAITCSGLPLCSAYHHSGRTWEFGPFDFDVL